MSASGNGQSWGTAKKTVQEAITAAQGATSDQVWVAAFAGVYTPGTNRTDSILLKSDVRVFGGFAGTEMTLEERDPLTNVTILSGEIQGDNDQTNNSFSVVKGNQATGIARLDGFVIEKGYGGTFDGTSNSYQGAGILCRNGSRPTIANCIIRNNVIIDVTPGPDERGAGMFVQDTGGSSTPIRIENCAFQNNEASSGGGLFADSDSTGLDVQSCQFTLNFARREGGGMTLFGNVNSKFRDCTFSTNAVDSSEAYAGGGAYIERSTTLLRNCVFSTNAITGSQSTMLGGGLANEGFGVTAILCTFNGNQIVTPDTDLGVGGGAWIQSSTENGAVLDCIFHDNRVQDTLAGLRGDGGGLAAGNVHVTNSLFYDNAAANGGGINVYGASASPKYRNCTVARNNATSGGGALVGSGAPTLRNCIFWINTGGQTTEEAQITNSVGTNLTVAYTDIQGWASGGQYDMGNNVQNFGQDPLFFNTLLDNFRIKPCSPCVDRGDSPSATEDGEIGPDVDEDNVETCSNNNCTNGERVPDLDLHDRVVGDPSNPGVGVQDVECQVGCHRVVDLGAYELQAYCLSGLRGDLNGDGAVNALDIQPFVDCQLAGLPLSAECACGDMNGDGRITSLDIPCFVHRILFGNDSCTACPGGGGSGLTGGDCNTNGIPDDNDIADGTSTDCNRNGLPDECEISSESTATGGPWYCIDDCDPDVNNNGVIDSCEPDCDHDGLPDAWEISQQTANDVNSNGIPDNCETDCNANGVPDSWDISQSTTPDCNANGIPDGCEYDCNGNGVPDDCDINPADPDGNGQVSADCNANGLPDSCDLARTILNSFDCNSNGIPDECDIASGTSQDCNANGFPDSCDIASGRSQDTNSNGIPDECETGGGSAPQAGGGEGGGEAPAEPDDAWLAFWQWYEDMLMIGEDGATLDQMSSYDQYDHIVDKLADLGLPTSRPW